MAEQVEKCACPQRFNFTIGCDPEFGLASGTSARASVSRSRHWQRGNLRGEGAECGLDGMPRIFELRPKPAFCAGHLVENIGKAFQTQREYFSRSRSRFIASPYSRYACGGHIHFGMRDTDAEKITRFLDFMLIPSIKRIYPAESWQKRARTGYGANGSFRFQPWGFEYRTPPTFLAEKPLALAVLSLAGAVAEYAQSGGAMPPDALFVEQFPKHPSFSKRWPEITYLKWLADKSFVVREDTDIKRVWL